METIIRILKEMREKSERSFIENSIIVHTAIPESRIPDTRSDLEMVIQLNQAISVLESSMTTKWDVNHN